MNTGPVKQERRDPCWQDNLTHSSSQQVRWWKHLHLRPMILRKKIYCKKCQERVERLSQQNRVIKICTDAGFLTTVEVGQYFMTKDTEEFSQFTEPVTCREYTLPRDEKSSDPKGWIRGNTKIGPVLEVTTSYLQGKYGVEIGIESVNKDNSHSWVRISHGLNKWSRTWSTKSTTTTSRKPLRWSRTNLRWKRMYLLLRDDQRLKQNHEDVFLLAHPQELYLSWYWARNLFEYRFPSVKTTDYSSSSWSSTSRRRWSDWILEIKRLSSVRIWELSALVWWNVEERNGRRRRQQEKISILYWLVRTRISLSPSSPRSFKTQSHWSFTSGQCVNSGQFLRVHLSYWMCYQFTLHHKFRIDTRRTKFGQGKTDSILYGCESFGQGTQRSVQAWLDRTTSCMVQARVEKAPRYGVLSRFSACSTKRIEVLSNKIERNHLVRHTPSLLYPESCCDGIWRNHIRESICVTSASSKDFL